jgi:hypothetical protein
VDAAQSAAKGADPARSGAKATNAAQGAGKKAPVPARASSGAGGATGGGKKSGGGGSDGPAKPTGSGGGGGGGTNIYRGMTKSDGGTPKLGDTKRTLGAKPGSGAKDDILPDAKGMVHPRSGGMSVSPDSPRNLPDFRRGSDWGGSGKDPTWEMNTRELPDGLSYRPDPANPKGHGFVEPSRSMPFQEYQDLIQGTAGIWRIVRGPDAS